MTTWLLDTHTWIWMASNPGLLPVGLKKAVQARKKPRLLLSLASIWELTIKQSLGRIELSISVAEMARLSSAKLGTVTLPIEFRHLEVLASLPLERHRDPFDRILVAQAVSESALLVSRDSALDAYLDLKRIWE